MILRILRENIRTSWVTLLQCSEGGEGQNPFGLERNLLIPVSTAGAEVCLFMSVIHHGGLKPRPWPWEGMRLCQVHVIVFSSITQTMTCWQTPCSPLLLQPPHPHPASKRRQTLTRFYTFAALVSLARQSQLRSEERPGAVHSDPSTRNVSRGWRSGN